MRVQIDRAAAAAILGIVALALAAAAPGSAEASGGRSGRHETRAQLDAVVVGHVNDLLFDRFDAAWARIHPADRRAVGRNLWESCKRTSEASLASVRYLGVDVIGKRAAPFSSRLHRHVVAVAVTIRVQALVSGAPLTVTNVSHWVVVDGRWARLIEQSKLAAYAAERCPA